jgi:hypothetical protein
LSDDAAIAAVLDGGRAKLACFADPSDSSDRDDVWFQFPVQLGKHGPAALDELAFQHGISLLYDKAHATFAGGEVTVDGWDPSTRRIIGRAAATWRDGPLGPASVQVRFNAGLMPPR